MTYALNPLDLRGWAATTRQLSRSSISLIIDRADTPIEVLIERCEGGRLQDAYPVSEHDVEVRIAGAGVVDSDVRRRLLTDIVAALASVDPRCRRLVYAVPVGDLPSLKDAESAGFRFVVDVDLPGESLSLTVTEPEWVTRVDMDLDHVPQT